MEYIGSGASLVAQQYRTTYSAGDAGDVGSIPGKGRSPGEGNENSRQCLCLENAMDRGAWRTAVYGIKKQSDMI